MDIMDIISIITCACALCVVGAMVYDKIKIRLGLRKMSKNLDKILSKFDKTSAK